MDAENNKENFLERVDKMMNKLMKAVTDENGNIADTPLVEYVIAKFTASILLGIQETTLDFEVADSFTKAVKDLMAIMGKDMKIQSIKNQIAENEKFITETKIRLAERDKKIIALEEKYKMNMRLSNSDEVN